MSRSFSPLPGLHLFKTERFRDERGWFEASYLKTDVDAVLDTPVTFVQDNHSQSARGVIRGLHLQRAPFCQGKLVRVMRGVIYDVCVDLRLGSATRGQWFGAELREGDGQQLWIPPGFAHGFQTLSDVSEVLYKTTAGYAPHVELVVRWDDPTLAIVWPYVPSALSAKDQSGLTIASALSLLDEESGLP